ncbi:C-X-C motif chemokine 6-like [Onychostruthus taczanowskii]|uniref:C-X-C motif chemokine 6-like n=1 Tax=Onychostruthus taczanowskii TaxID=356909 RepID=UPI001B803C35|nr:C-X-C motif chemokine 6-like [Onychostruthus taczanowskii]
MAVRAALLLAVLLLCHRPGDAGEPPLVALGVVRAPRVGDAGGTMGVPVCGVMPCAPPAILEANGNLSCRCLKSTRAFIPPERYSSIEVWPVGSSCRRPEVVVKLKSLKRVCVDPDTPWMRKLLQDLPHLRKKKAPR